MPSELVSVLFVNGSAAIEGDTRVLINTVRTLDPAVYRRSCVTAPGAACDELRGIQGVRVFEAPLGPAAVLLPGRAGSALAFAQALWGTIRAARAVRADVIYTYDRTRAAEVAYVVARLLRKKLFFHAHYPYNLEHRALRRQVAFRSDRIVAISEFVAGHYRAAGCPSERLSVVLNGTEAPGARESSTDLRAQLAIAREAPVVGIVGRLSPWKGQEELIRAFAIVRRSVPAAHLIIAGRDTDESTWTHGPAATSYRAILERVRDELGLDDAVHIIGFNASAADVYAASDVVAAPSHAEPFGLVIIEGMLAGKPVVTCAAGGPLEIVRDGETGLLVPPEDPEALAEALLRMLGDAALRKRIAKAGEADARERFSLERYGADISAAFASVAART